MSTISAAQSLMDGSMMLCFPCPPTPVALHPIEHRVDGMVAVSLEVLTLSQSYICSVRVVRPDLLSSISDYSSRKLCRLLAVLDSVGC